MILRLAWVGPWNTQSSIAMFGVDITSALAAQGHSIEIIRSERGQSLAIEQRASRLRIYQPWELSFEEIADRYDAVIVNLGNHYPFHGHALDILLHVPNCVAILHDRWMVDFVYGWRFDSESDAEAIDAWLAREKNDPSMVKALASLSPAAVVHGQHYFREVSEACAGPIQLLPLSQHMPVHAPRSRTNDRLQVLTIGHANPNKRIDEVIRGIGCVPELRARVDYTIAGPIDPAERERLCRIARASDVTEPRFTGWVTDEELYDIVEDSDVVCCLRYPSTEGGSGSLLTAMLASRPSLVSDNSVFAEAPDDVVFKCAPGAEAGAVASHLLRLLRDPSLGPEVGRRARDHALEANNVEFYARELAAYVIRTLPALPIYGAARTTGRTLGDFGMNADDPAVQRAIVDLQDLRG